MFSIFKKQKKTEEQVDDPGVVQVSSASASSDQPNLISGTLGKAKNIINGVIQSFEKLRCDEEFLIFWQKLELLAEQNSITLDIPDISIIQLTIQIYFI